MSANNDRDSGRSSPFQSTILIADDSPEILSVLSDLLQPHYRVRVANSGARALAVAVTEPKPDLILLDVMMTGMDGYEVLSRLRKQPATQDIPVIFVTGLDAEGDEERGLELGAVDYITKPIRPAVVLARVRAHLELKEARDLLRYENALVIETAEDWIFLKDRDLRYTIVNPAMQRDFPGVSLLGLGDREVLASDIAAEMEAVDRRVLRGEVVRDERDIPLHSGLRTLSITKVPMRDRAGNVVGLCGIGRDVSEQRLLSAQLLQAQKMETVGRLAGGIAHDFNNLLQAMLSQVAIVRRAPQGAILKRTLDTVDQLVRRGAALTRQLLLFARHETPAQESLDLNEVVRGAGELLRPVMRENVTLRFELAESPVMIDADKGQIDQVLMNLVINAFDALSAGGVVVVSTGQDETSAWLSVRDTGHGIPDDVRARLFEPFFTTKARGKGTGLGLSVVHGIVTGHHGHIEVESPPGEGATFKVLLPRGAGAAGPPHESNDETAVAPGHGEHILLVEDEKGAREGLALLLEMMEYRVTAAANGEEALTLSDSTRFDLLVTDITLPGISGDNLAATLQRKQPHLRTVLMSGYTQDKNVREMITASKRTYLQKPFDTPALSRALQRARNEQGQGGKKTATIQ